MSIIPIYILMLTTLLLSLIMFQTHFMEVQIFLLMSSTRSMPFPLGIHLLQGQATPPDHLSGPILNNLGPQSPSKGMMALSTCHLKYAMEALEAYNTEAIKRFHRGRSTTLKLWKCLRMTLLRLV